MVSFFASTCPNQLGVAAIDNPDWFEHVFDRYDIPEAPEKIFTHEFLMIGRQKMFIFGIIKAFTNNFTDYNLYKRKAMTRKNGMSFIFTDLQRKI